MFGVVSLAVKNLPAEKKREIRQSLDKAAFFLGFLEYGNKMEVKTNKSENEILLGILSAGTILLNGYIKSVCPCLKSPFSKHI